MRRVSLPQAVVICWVFNILEVVAGFLCLPNASELGIVFIGGVGLVQLVYVIPLYLKWKREGNADATNGLIIAASVTALLNATCWGFFWRSGL